MIIEGGITIGNGISITDTIEVTQAFSSSGNLTIPANRQIQTATMLLVAGGGGGSSGIYSGGGGGGGSIMQQNILPNIASGNTYTITVGSGGAIDANGAASSAFGFTVSGGNRGFGTQGSGGTSGNGYAGGTGATNAGGSGGGFNAVGFNATSGAGGNGNNGVNAADYGWSDTYFTDAGYTNGFFVSCGGGGGGSSSTGQQFNSPGTGGKGRGVTASTATAGNAGFCIVKYTYIPG